MAISWCSAILPPTASAWSRPARASFKFAASTIRQEFLPRSTAAATGCGIFTGVTGNITIRLRGGDDVLRITNCIAPGAVVVDGGAGDNEVVTGQDQTFGNSRFGGTASGPLYVSGALRVAGGADDDLVYQSDLHVTGAGHVNLGAGDDTLHMQRPGGGSQNVEYGALAVIPEAGDDVIDVLGMVVTGNLTVNDAAGSLYLLMRSVDIGHDFLLTTSTRSDDIDVSATNVANLFRISTSGGSDHVRLACIADQLRVLLGAANDSLEIFSSNIRAASAVRRRWQRFLLHAKCHGRRRLLRRRRWRRYLP